MSVDSTQLSLEARIEALETRIAFQDQTIEELNLAVSQMRNQYDQIFSKVKGLSEAASASFVTKDGDNRPPHY